MNLLIARHAECKKNLIGIPGGQGTALTERGKQQAAELAKLPSIQSPKPSKLIACPVEQAFETASILAPALSLPVIVARELRSIFLGVLSGIPIDEGRQRFPSSSASMDEWRSGKLEISELRIDGMESPTAFYRRGLKFVLDEFQPDSDRTALVVCTTSLMILFHNIYDFKGVARGEGYRARFYQNAEAIKLSFGDRHLRWIEREFHRYEGS